MDGLPQLSLQLRSGPDTAVMGAPGTTWQVLKCVEKVASQGREECVFCSPVSAGESQAMTQRSRAAAQSRSCCRQWQFCSRSLGGKADLLRTGRQGSQLRATLVLCRRLYWRHSGGRQAAVLQTHREQDVRSDLRVCRTGFGAVERRPFAGSRVALPREAGHGSSLLRSISELCHPHDKHSQRGSS